MAVVGSTFILRDVHKHYRFPDSPTAADVVNSLSTHDLAHILKKYGEERKAQQIANIIVEARYTFGKFSRTKQLADVILSAFNR